MTDTKCLNTLKLLAACVIAFGWHYQSFGAEHVRVLSQVFPWCFQWGWLSVELFFTLSGFGMYLGYADRIREGRIGFCAYIGKRLRKIYPLFFVTLCIVTLLQFLHLHLTGQTFVYDFFDLRHFLMNVFLVQDGIFGTEYSFNGPAWSISTFFLLYLVFYLVLRLAGKRSAVLAVFGMLFLLGAGVIALRLDYPFLLNTLTGRGLASFSEGVFAAEFFRSRRRIPAKAVGYLSLLPIAVYYAMFRLDIHIADYSALYYALGIAPATVFAVLYIPLLNRTLSAKPLLRLSDGSMELYLLHFPVQCTLAVLIAALGLHPDCTGAGMWLLYAACALLAMTAAVLLRQKLQKKRRISA